MQTNDQSPQSDAAPGARLLKTGTAIGAIRVLPGRIRHGLTDRTFALSFLELNDG
jgi:hypothetical protein